MMEPVIPKFGMPKLFMDTFTDEVLSVLENMNVTSAGNSTMPGLRNVSGRALHTAQAILGVRYGPESVL